MRRLCISILLLLLVLAGTMWSTHHLAGISKEVTSLLTQAEHLGEGGSWEEALSLTCRAEVLWKEHEFFFHVILRHSDTDNVTHSFQEVKEFLHCREGGEYSAANAILIGRIELLVEQERCTLKNLL